MKVIVFSSFIKAHKRKKNFKIFSWIMANYHDYCIREINIILILSLGVNDRLRSQKKYTFDVTFVCS